MDCSKCEALCCYDGVYITQEEKIKIQDFINKHKEYFSDLLDRPLFVKGTWPGFENEIKTNIVPYNFKKKPKHFNNTRWVFVDKDNRCRLQKVCIELGLDEWSIKPKSCCVFPLRIKDGQILPPPQNIDEDEYNIGKDYPGYASCLKCSKINKNTWKQDFKKEIEYSKKHNKTIYI